MEWNAMRSFIDSLREQSANTNAPVSLDKGQAEKKAKFDAAQKATDPANATAGGSEAIVKQGDSAETVKEDTVTESDKPEFKSTYKKFNDKAKSQKSLASLAEPKDKVTKKDVLVGRGVLAKEDVDQEILYKSIEVEVKESAEYADYFKAALSSFEVASPLDLAEDVRSEFFALVDESFNTKDIGLFVEAWMRGDVQDKMDMHKKAGNKVTDVVHTNKGGQSYHSFVVTEPSGKRTRHIFHGNSRKLETMSPAPKSKEAHETGEDEDDK